MNRKIIIQVVLVVVVFALAYVFIVNMRKPIEFKSAYEIRKTKVVERLKEIRALQQAYKSVRGVYTSSFDTLENFYKTGQMQTLRSVGSLDDSATQAQTKDYEKRYEEQQKQIKSRRPIKGERLVALVDMADDEVIKLGLAVRKPIIDEVRAVVRVDTVLLSEKPNFNIDELRYVPGVEVNGNVEKPQFEMEAKIKETISKVQVPLFAAMVPNEVFLKGLNKQEIANLSDEQMRKNLSLSDEDKNQIIKEQQGELSAEERKNFAEEKKKWEHYPGLRVGSINNPNNDAGNWE
ncbi:MAG: hypothetical protein LBH30_00420 [Prevotellaceae bacterium]|jgi:hypothetical protein|nr:hypothetical protein [Prevotellaceae bacterium]